MYSLNFLLRTACHTARTRRGCSNEYAHPPGSSQVPGGERIPALTTLSHMYVNQPLTLVLSVIILFYTKVEYRKQVGSRCLVHYNYSTTLLDVACVIDLLIWNDVWCIYEPSQYCLFPFCAFRHSISPSIDVRCVLSAILRDCVTSLACEIIIDYSFILVM